MAKLVPWGPTTIKGIYKCHRQYIVQLYKNKKIERTAFDSMDAALAFLLKQPKWKNVKDAKAQLTKKTKKAQRILEVYHIRTRNYNISERTQSRYSWLYTHLYFFVATLAILVIFELVITTLMIPFFIAGPICLQEASGARSWGARVLCENTLAVRWKHVASCNLLNHEGQGRRAAFNGWSCARKEGHF
jgi:hypothetical protein